VSHKSWRCTHKILYADFDYYPLGNSHVYQSKYAPWTHVFMCSFLRPRNCLILKIITGFFVRWMSKHIRNVFNVTQKLVTYKSLMIWKIVGSVIFFFYLDKEIESRLQSTIRSLFMSKGQYYLRFFQVLVIGSTVNTFVSKSIYIKTFTLKSNYF
jgi:hypothetical protein